MNLMSWQASWPRIYAEEREKIEAAFVSEGLKANMYHIGSTSIEGMVGKPVIDLLVCPAEGTTLDDCREALERLGYGMPGPDSFILERVEGENERFRLSLCHADHRIAMDRKLFRFILQNDVCVRNSYAALKLALATEHPHCESRYDEGKGRFIESVLAAYRLGAGTAFDPGEKGDRLDVYDDASVRYWLFEFQMSEDMQRRFNSICEELELTPDEFFERVLRNAVEFATTDPEGFQLRMQEWQKQLETDTEPEITLLRQIPVHWGETRAEAYRRKLSEERMGREAEDSVPG